MRMMGAGVALAVLLLGDVAQADCASPYTTANMAADLGDMTRDLRDLNEQQFVAGGARLATGLPCLNTALPASAYASAYRYIGTYHLLSSRDDQARAWYRTALELDPSFEWDINDLPIDNPIRVVFEEERGKAVVEPVRVEAKVLLPPEGAYLLLDGRKMRRAEATIERPHLLQVVSSGNVTSAQIIEGNAIPDEYLNAGEEAGAKPKALASQVYTVQRVRPPLKTPLLIIGGVTTVAGIGLYAGSMVTHAKFTKATTTADVLRLQGVTNTLVIASSACLLVGVGSGYAGIMLDAGPGFWYTTRF
jgi:hypothetical protein